MASDDSAGPTWAHMSRGQLRTLMVSARVLAVWVAGSPSRPGHTSADRPDDGCDDADAGLPVGRHVRSNGESS
jgi:hypothetical protein